MLGKQLPDLSEPVERKPQTKKINLPENIDESVAAVVEKIANQPNLILETEITPMILALNRAGVDNKLIANSVKKLMQATKTIVLGAVGERYEKKIPDNNIILAATKFASVLRDVLPAKKIAGKFAHLHGSIPKGQSSNILRDREYKIKATQDADFEVIDDTIN